MGEEVKAFLARLGLSSYAPHFVAEGFDCMENLKLMQSEDMIELGMKLGHSRVLKEALNKFSLECTPELGLCFPVQSPFLPYPAMQMPWGMPYVPWLGCTSPLVWPSAQCPISNVTEAAKPTSNYTNFPDKHMVLTVGLARLLMLQENLASAYPELFPFTKDGEIGMLCAYSLQDAPGELRNRMSRALDLLNNARKARTVNFLSPSQLIQAAFTVAEHVYEEAYHEVSPEHDEFPVLKASHDEFKKCCRSLAHHLFRAMAVLKPTPRSSMQKLKHSLKTVILLACIDAAEGHLSRDAINSTIARNICHCTHVPAEVQTDIISSLWHCFSKVFADLPGASRFKAKRKQTQSAVVVHLEENQQHETGTVQPAADRQQQEDGANADVFGDAVNSAPDSSSQEDGAILKETEDVAIIEHAMIEKNTFLHIADPSADTRKIKSEPGNRAAVLGLVQEDEERILLISELNSALVFRDYYGKYSDGDNCKEGIQLKNPSAKLYIRPGAAEFVSTMLEHDRCQLAFQSCSNPTNAQDMAQHLLKAAVPGEWVLHDENKPPFFVGPCDRRVYVVDGNLASDVPKDYEGKPVRVKYMEPVCEMLCWGDRFFSASNTIMIDSDRSIPNSDKNLLQIPSWWEWKEDGSIFRELQDYLLKLFSNTPLPKVPGYLDQNPCKFSPSASIASSEATEVLNALASKKIQRWARNRHGNNDPAESVQQRDEESEPVKPFWESVD